MFSRHLTCWVRVQEDGAAAAPVRAAWSDDLLTVLQSKKVNSRSNPNYIYSAKEIKHQAL